MFSYRIMTLILSLFLCLNCAENVSAQSDPLSLHSLFGAEVLRSNVNAVRRRAAGLSAAARYDYLKNWVLPSETHPDFRVIGEFTPTDPSPPAMELEPHRFSSDHGGELVSPVFDLLEAAEATGKLQELAAVIERIPDPENSAQLRSKLVLQILLAMELRDANAIDRLAPELFSKTSATFKWRGVNYWPELHLICWSMDHRANYRLAGTLLSDLYIQRSSIRMPLLWKSHVLAWMGRYEDHLARQGDRSEIEQTIPAGWIPVTRETARSNSIGYPSSRWKLNDSREVILHSGHNEDYLVFQSPLMGNYQVESQMDEGGTSQIQLLGQFVGAQAKGKSIAAGTFRKDAGPVPVSYPVARRDKSVHYRGKVEGSQATVFLNGQQVGSYVASGDADPWLALRSVAGARGRFLNVQIAGRPTIPESVVMSTSEELTAWSPYYEHSESVGTPDADWIGSEEETGAGAINGRRSDTVRGSWCESLLQYQRPLVEDGSIEYEFWYVPGESAAHPAFDRLVFLLRPRGVRLHWLTDGKYDSTGVLPENVSDDPQHRIGSRSLPLKAHAWNQMIVSTRGDRVLLELNGRRIYERPLEPANARTFGLFHYSDRTALRVRDVVMRADWPKSLPAVEEQELSDPLLAVVDRDSSHLKSVFIHDFAEDGLPADYFKLVGRNAEQRLIARPDGLHARLTPYAAWNMLGVVPHFSLEGDFDVEVEFDRLQLSNIVSRGQILLQTTLDDEQTHWLRAVRGQSERDEQHFNGAITYELNPEKRQFQGDHVGEGADSGRLRISRRGTDFYAMFAEGDSTVYRIIRHGDIPAANVKLHGIELKLFLKDSGSVSAVWKKMSIRAEKMFYLADGKKRIRKLFSMSPDGKNVRELAAPKFGLSGLGSPEFSPDGSRIVMDMSQGPVSTSHIVSMNRDGSDMKDLGMGCMPSLSKDGKTIVFSDPGAGIVKMDADGKNRETIERSGWGVQYSPDGKHIAYSSYSNFTLMDPKTGKKTPLLEGELANRYARIYWNFGWSHDSQAIAFKGHVRATGQQELAVVDINKPDKIEVLYTGNGIYEDFTFSPDSQSVLFALRQEGPTQPDLYLAHRKTPGQIERLKGQPDDFRILDCDWSPDGKQIVFAALVDPTPVEWRLGQNE